MEGKRYLDGVYFGSLKDGHREGRGTFIWDDGRRYAGGWLNDKMHGTGSMFDADGNEIAYAVWYAGEIIYEIGDSWGERPQKESRRVALLIGNCAYPGNAHLNNCVSDAKILSKKLQSLGFDSTVVCDAKKSSIVSSVRSFSTKARGAEAALFFFSGHGISVDGKTYMIPVDAGDHYTIDSAFFCIDDVVNILDEVGCNIKIAVIDACRVNPYKGLSKGLYETKARNVLVAYATSPNYEASDGLYGTHSPYIDVILQLLDEPRIPLSRFFEEVSARVYELTNGRQQPFIESSLIPNNDFFFNYG